MKTLVKTYKIRLFFLGMIVVGLAQCGDDSEDPKTSPQSPARQSLPAGWDGLEDWSGSVLKFKDKP